MSTSLQATLTAPFCLQSPVYAVEGETRYYSIEFLGVTTISSATVTVYSKKRDVTATVMPSGSHTTSGNVLTLKPAVFGTGGRYVITAQVTCDSADVKIAKILVIVQRKQMEQ